MEFGIVTDAHSNPWGENAVIDHLEQRGLTSKYIINLGDIVGMFPEAIASADIAKSRCALTLVGNHDAVLAEMFEDDPKREERIKAIEFNKKRISYENRGDIIEWIKSFPIEYESGGVYFTHNSPFDPKSAFSREFMLARFGPLMKDPSDLKYDQDKSKVLTISNFPQQVLVRGHAHLPSVYKVKRGMETEEENSVEYTKMTGGQDRLKMDIDPDFVYIVTSGSACGANTMFTPDEDLDYRPAGGIIEYDEKSQRGRIDLFRTTEGYYLGRFLGSVLGDLDWGDMPEASKQVTHLERGVFFNS